MNIRATCLWTMLAALLLVNGVIPRATAIGGASTDQAKRFRVELRRLPLVDGQRIARLEVNVREGDVRSVSVPRDWSAEIGFRDLHDGTWVVAEAGHGVSYANSGEDLGVLLEVEVDGDLGGRRSCDDAPLLTGWMVLSTPDAFVTNEIPASSFLVQPVAAPAS